MVDISRIDLGELDKEGLEKVKLMLDISKIQQDIAESQARANKTYVDIEGIRQSVEQSRATVEKMRKENQWFPWLQIITTLTTGILTGGVVVFVLTKLLQ